MAAASGALTQPIAPSEVDHPTWRHRLGRVGVWSVPFGGDPGAAARVASTVESLGLGSLWVGTTGFDPAVFSALGEALDATEELVVATGIVSVWAWPPEALATHAAALHGAHPNRFILGLGVSHAPLVEPLGQAYRRPLAKMREFLADLDHAASGSSAGSQPPRVLAALGPKMLALAATRAQGAHPYFVPPEHTAAARAVLGPEPLLAPEVAVVLDANPTSARATARQYMTHYLTLPNYVENLRRLSYGDEDFADGGSDRLVDALIPWGDEGSVAAGLRAHLAAGADHVAVQPVVPSGASTLEALRRLAPTLRAL